MTLATLRPLVEVMAAERTGSRPDLFDDAVQEGLIAAWEVLERRPDAPTAYVTAAARNGVVRLLRGRSATGAASRQGRRDAADEAQAFPDDYDAPARPDLDELAAHRAEIHRAVAELEAPDALYVRARFWADLTAAEAARLSGRTPRALEDRWRNRIRPQLRSALAHLADAA